MLDEVRSGLGPGATVRKRPRGNLEKRSADADRGVSVQKRLFAADDLAIDMNLMDERKAARYAEEVVIEKHSINRAWALIVCYFESASLRIRNA